MSNISKLSKNTKECKAVSGILDDFEILQASIRQNTT